MPLPRPCKRCKKRFQPNTRANKLCEKCRDKASDWRVKKSNETRKKKKE